MTNTTRAALKSLVAHRGIEEVLDALRLEMAEAAAQAAEEDQPALYEAQELVEQAWMALPEFGTAEA
jgi:hypothetical protein